MTTGGHRPVTLSAWCVVFDHGGRSLPRGKLRENGEFFDGKNFTRCDLFKRFSSSSGVLAHLRSLQKWMSWGARHG